MDSAEKRNMEIQKKINLIKDFKQLKELADTKPIAIVNSEGMLTSVNNSFESIFKLKEGDSFSSLQSDPQIPLILENLNNNNYRSFQLELFLLDEFSVPTTQLSVDINRILIDKVDYFVLNFTSQNEKKRIEERISNLSNALEYGDVPVIIASENGNINYVSKSFEEILNKGIDKLFGSNIGELFQDFLEPIDHTSLVASIRQKKMWMKTISDISETGELWYKELKVNPVWQSTNALATFIVTANDITHYITKNRVIKKSEERQKLIINNISDPLLIIKKNENQLLFENANENFFSMFELKKLVVKEKPISVILPFNFNEKVDVAIDEVESDGDEYIEFRYRKESTGRDYICKLSHANDLFERGKLYIISFNDITEQLNTEKMLRQAYEQETRVNKLKSAFLANMSHEIRTPLNAIVGYSDLLEDDITEKNYDALPEILGYLKDGVDRLLALVYNIVEVSMLESGEYQIDLCAYPVNSFLSGIEYLYAEEADQKHISFDLDLDPLNPFINVDEIKFKKVLETLVHNAIKYNRDNGIIMITSETDGDWVIVKITDTGIGIQPDKVKKILEPFMQVEEEGFTRNYEGAGLGLTIAHRLTQLFKGKFDVESQLNEGTTIKISLPLGESNKKET